MRDNWKPRNRIEGAETALMPSHKSRFEKLSQSRSCRKRDFEARDRFIFSLTFLSLRSHAAQCPFFLGEGFSLAGAITFHNGPCKLERRAASFPVATNDYQRIRAGRQGTGQRGARGVAAEETATGGGGHAPRRQRFSSLVAASKPSPYITSLQSTKPPYTSRVVRWNQSALRGWLRCCMSAGGLRQESKSPITRKGTGKGTAETWGLSDSPNSHSFSLPFSFLLICPTKVLEVSETLLCSYIYIYCDIRIKSKAHHCHK